MTLYEPAASTNAATEKTSWPMARCGAYAQKRKLVQHVGVRGYRLLRVGQGVQGGFDVDEIGRYGRGGHGLITTARIVERLCSASQMPYQGEATRFLTRTVTYTELRMWDDPCKGCASFNSQCIRACDCSTARLGQGIDPEARSVRRKA